MTPQIKQRIEQIRRGEVPDGYKRTKIGVVPSEWEDTLFSDLFTSTSDYTDDLDRYPLYSLTIEDGITAKTERYERSHLVKKENAYKIVRPNDFAYNPMNVRFGAVARHKGNSEVSISGYYDIFTTKVASDLEFMDSFLISDKMITYYNKVSIGSLVEKQRVHFTQFMDFRLPLSSESERKKIAEILSAQDKLIALKEKLIEEKKRQKKALMQQLLTGKQRFHGFFDEWCHKRISDICDVLDTLRKPLNASERAGRKKEYPYYGANGIVDYIDEYLLDDSVILLAEDGGNFENFNNKPIAYWVEGKCWVNNHAHILKPQKKYCEKFVFYALEHKDIRMYINGTTRSKLTQEDLLAIDIFLPTQIEEQQMIAKILGALDREVSLLQKDLGQEKQKKKALMQLLLTGIVRV